jgi:hypothetical protein
VWGVVLRSQTRRNGLKRLHNSTHGVHKKAPAPPRNLHPIRLNPCKEVSQTIHSIAVAVLRGVAVSHTSHVALRQHYDEFLQNRKDTYWHGLLGIVGDCWGCLMAFSDCLILVQTVTDCCGFFRSCCVTQEPRSMQDRLI